MITVIFLKKKKSLYEKKYLLIINQIKNLNLIFKNYIKSFIIFI